MNSFPKLRLLTWNIGFAGGLNGLTGDIGTKADVCSRLSKIAEVLTDANADVVCLQEVDRCSKRSFYINQIAYLSEKAGYPYKAFVQTWRSPWIPYPMTWRLDKHFGPMDAGQVILSRYPITWHAYVTHPKPDSRSGLFKYFYLDRVSQFAAIEMTSDKTLFLGHLHLEAFDSLARQMQANTLLEILKPWRETLNPMVICGDFNAIQQSPGSVFSFPDEPCIIYENDETLGCFLREFVSAGMAASLRDYPSSGPNRQLTHVFHTSELTSTSYQVLPTSVVSDHLPGLVVYE
jgi:endonuclease/exonuclease/phosphatase family metal-dependent hydrolase